jgi:hypothetical protein
MNSNSAGSRYGPVMSYCEYSGIFLGGGGGTNNFWVSLVTFICSRRILWALVCDVMNHCGL